MYEQTEHHFYWKMYKKKKNEKKKYNNSIIEKCKKIKLVLVDVDGVLTDGTRYYSSKGEELKNFHTRDGMGVTLLRKKNIPTILVTKEKTKIVKQWATRMKIAKLYDGIKQNESILEKVCKKIGVTSDEIVYIENDINDVKFLKKFG